MAQFNQITDQSTNWTLNETLLQSYRTIFIASQSLLLSGVALTIDKWIHVLIILIAISQLYVGYQVVVHRAIIVDFYKYNLSECCKLEVYLSDKPTRLTANENIPRSTNWRPTRVMVDRFVPASFLLLWLAFLIQFIVGKL